MQKKNSNTYEENSFNSDSDSQESNSEDYYTDDSETEEIPQPKKEINPLDLLDKRRKIKMINDTSDLSKIIYLSRDKDPEIRLKAVQNLCPCRIKRDFDIVYERLFELSTDENTKVRFQVLHNICDGSPQQYEERVMKALDNFNRDKDKKIRRTAHKIMASVARRGKWNIM